MKDIVKGEVSLTKFDDFGSPLSQGCIIGRANDYLRFTGAMKDMGFTFSDEKLQEIKVKITLSENHIPTDPTKFKNHYKGTIGN